MLLRKKGWRHAEFVHRANTSGPMVEISQGPAISIHGDFPLSSALLSDIPAPSACLVEWMLWSQRSRFHWRASRIQAEEEVADWIHIDSQLNFRVGPVFWAGGDEERGYRHSLHIMGAAVDATAPLLASCFTANPFQLRCPYIGVVLRCARWDYSLIYVANRRLVRATILDISKINRPFDPRLFVNSNEFLESILSTRRAPQLKGETNEHPSRAG